MAREDAGLAVEQEKFLEDVPHHDVVVSARVVCTADCSGKYGVSAEEYFLISLKEAYSAHTMTWCLDDFKVEAADLDARRSICPLQ